MCKAVLLNSLTMMEHNLVTLLEKHRCLPFKYLKPSIIDTLNKYSGHTLPILMSGRLIKNRTTGKSWVEVAYYADRQFDGQSVFLNTKGKWVAKEPEDAIICSPDVEPVSSDIKREENCWYNSQTELAEAYYSLLHNSGSIDGVTLYLILQIIKSPTSYNTYNETLPPKSKKQLEIEAELEKYKIKPKEV